LSRQEKKTETLSGREKKKKKKKKKKKSPALSFEKRRAGPFQEIFGYL
jgi:hypothetical protein